MEPKYTTAELRDMSRQLTNVKPMHPFGVDRAAAMLDWAANVIDAANRALSPSTSTGGK